MTHLNSDLSSKSTFEFCAKNDDSSSTLSTDRCDITARLCNESMLDIYECLLDITSDWNIHDHLFVIIYSTILYFSSFIEQ